MLIQITAAGQKHMLKTFRFSSSSQRASSRVKEMNPFLSVDHVKHSHCFKTLFLPSLPPLAPHSSLCILKGCARLILLSECIFSHLSLDKICHKEPSATPMVSIPIASSTYSICKVLSRTEFLEKGKRFRQEH